MEFSNPFDDRPKALEAKAVTLLASIALFNLVAWAVAVAVFAQSPVLLGTALLAYVLGLRHGFDLDHIAAIDNVVRKLVQDGKRPIATGFFFALGHSTIVVTALVVVVAAMWVMPDAIAAVVPGAGSFGTIVSASFLLLIGGANLSVLDSLWRAARRPPELRAASLERGLDRRGFVARLVGPLLRMVSRSWHLYPVGLLFGLGFDTASEIGLLGISATHAAPGSATLLVMVLPILFTAGMVLVDTLDSVLMTGTYGWALVHPERKLLYNLVVTAASVMVAGAIALVEIIGVLRDRPDLIVWLRDLVGSAPLADLGVAAIAVLVVTWIVFFAIFRRRRYENLPRSPG